MNLDDRYREVAQMMAGRGPVADPMVELFKVLVKEDQIDLLLAFKEKRSQNMDQLKESSGLSEEVILEKTDALARRGLIFNQPNSAGDKVFRLLPLANVGVYEYTFMKKLTGSEEEQKIADLFAKMRAARPPMKLSPEQAAAMLARRPAVDRSMPIQKNKATGEPTVIAVNEEIEGGVDKILLTQNVVDLIEKFDEIAVGHCFCRQFKDTQGDHCKQTDLRENCFTFGKSARFTTENEFMRMITKEEALKILYESEKDGLVHKAYHPNFDITKPETSICNCCYDCCGNSRGAIVTVSTHLAHVDPELCEGCETCAETCHPKAITLGDDGKSHVDEDRCIGCGVCAYMCPQNAIQLKQTAPRTVRAPALQND